MPLATTIHECAHPCWLTDAAKKSLHPIWNGERVSSTNDVKSNGSVTTIQPIAKLTKYPGHQDNIRYKRNNRPRCQQPRDEHSLHVHTKHSPIAFKCLVTRTVNIQQRRKHRYVTILQEPYNTHPRTRFQKRTDTANVGTFPCKEEEQQNRAVTL